MDTTSKPKVKVLINALHAKSGGGATYATNMIPKLADHPDLEIYVVIEDAAKLPKNGPDNVNYVLVSAPRNLISLAIFEQFQVASIARRLQVDVVFSLANYGPTFVSRGVLMLRNAMGVGLLDPRWSQRVYWSLVYVATVVSVVRSRHVIAVSDFAKHSGGALLSWLISEKCSVIFHGVNDVFKQRKTPIDRNKFALCVSDIYVQKNFGNLFEAIAILQTRGVVFELKIAGAAVDEKYAHGLRQIAKRLGIEKHITYLGQVDQDELKALYERCRVFIFPSLVETFGNPLLEAMACGAPIACSNAAAMPEIAGDVPVYFDPLDVEGMADAIELLYTDADLRKRVSDKANARASQFGWDLTAEKTADVLKRVAKR